MTKKCISVFVSLLLYGSLPAQDIEKSLSGVEVKPFGRMIRPCCVFGYDLPVFGFRVHMGYTTSTEKLGHHVFYGNKEEINGIIYTRDGGFVDIGHVRDNADVTAFFALQIAKNMGKNFIFKTTREGGKRTGEIFLEGKNLNSKDIVQLAQRITYEMAVWHEIRTYFGVPTHYPIHEVQSAFSPEDHYSNLLGTYAGRWALERGGNYETAMDTVIQELMIKLGAVKTEAETKAAMDSVRGIWWQRVSLPSRNFLLKWNTPAYGKINPWLIPGHTHFFNSPTQIFPLEVPTTTQSGMPLTDLFSINIKPGRKIPVAEIFNTQQKKIITQKDFPTIIAWIEQDLISSEHARLGKKAKADKKFN